MKISLGKMFAIVAFIALIFGVIVNLDFEPKPIAVTKDLLPKVNLSATHIFHEYDISSEGDVTNIVVNSPDCPLYVLPMVEWDVETTSNSLGFVRYRNKNFALNWDQKTLSSKNAGPNRGNHYRSIHFGGIFRVEQHWYEVQESPIAVVQTVRLYLIDDSTNRILRQHHLKIRTQLNLTEKEYP